MNLEIFSCDQKTLDLKNGEKNFKKSEISIRHIQRTSCALCTLRHFSGINSYNLIQRTHNFKPIFYANT